MTRGLVVMIVAVVLLGAPALVLDMERETVALDPYERRASELELKSGYEAKTPFSEPHQLDGIEMEFRPGLQVPATFDQEVE